MTKKLKINNVVISRETLGKVIPSLERVSKEEIKNFLKVKLNKELKPHGKLNNYITVDQQGTIKVHISGTYYNSNSWKSATENTIGKSSLLPEDFTLCCFRLNALIA